MKNLKKLSILGIFLLFLTSTFSQEKHDNQKHHSSKKHSIALVLSHTQINEGRDENNQKKWLSLPSWGINYNYSLSSKWMIGLHSDIVVEDFIVENFTKSSETIERSYPIASAIVASYKLKSVNLMFGSGVEFAKEENFFLLRTGVEYNKHLGNNYELIANITNDFKLNAYNSWAIGIGIAKLF